MYVPGVRNISFSQNFANEINKWSQGHIVFISKGCHIFFLVSTLIILSWRQSMMNRHNYHQIYGIRHADSLQCTISPRRQSTKYLCICWAYSFFWIVLNFFVEHFFALCLKAIKILTNLENNKYGTCVNKKYYFYI